MATYIRSRRRGSIVRVNVSPFIRQVLRMNGMIVSPDAVDLTTCYSDSRPCRLYSDIVLDYDPISHRC